MKAPCYTCASARGELYRCGPFTLCESCVRMHAPSYLEAEEPEETTAEIELPDETPSADDYEVPF